MCLGLSEYIQVQASTTHTLEWKWHSAVRVVGSVYCELLCEVF